MPPLEQTQKQDIEVLTRNDNRPFAQVVRDAVEARRGWARIQREIILRKAGARPRQRKRPYRNAPNFVEPIIDDVVREKTDVEISMMWNTPLLAHAQPLADVDHEVTQMAARSLDSYLRHIIKFRPKVEAAYNMRNARGFACFKLVRKFNHTLRREIPDIDVIDPFDVIVPSDARIDEEPPWMVHVLRLTPSEMRKNAETKGWQNVEAVITKAMESEREDTQVGGVGASGRTDDIYAVKKDIVGLTSTGTGSTSPTIVLWEIYRKASENEPAGETRPSSWPHPRASHATCSLRCSDRSAPRDRLLAESDAVAADSPDRRSDESR